MSEEKYILYGCEEPEKVPEPGDPTFTERLLGNLLRYGDEVAQISNATGETTTYKDIYEKAVRLSIALQKLGIKKGDVVAISSENRFEFTVCLIAIVAIGAVNATLNVLYTRYELIHTLKISKPKCIFASPLTLKSIINVAKDVPSLKNIISFGAERPQSSIILYQDLFPENVDISTFRPVKVDVMTQPVAILCSSGTTGLPKGVVLTHRNFIVGFAHLKFYLQNQLKGDAVFLSLLPWFHGFGFFGHLASLYMKMRVVFMVKFEEKPFLSAIEKYKVTLTMLVPPIMVFLAKHPLVDDYDISSLTEIWCAAAPLSKEIQETVSKRLNVRSVKQGYGMTETTFAVIHYGPKEVTTKAGSCGVVSPGVKAKVVDLTTGEALGPFKAGELCFKGPLMMKGYLGDAASTEHIFDSEGWLRTGDVAYYDEDKYVYIVDRIKELIKYNGFQVPPAEVEALLLTHPSVKDAAVIGLPDDKAGELPMAFIVKQSGANISADELIEFVAKRMSQPKRLHGGLKFVDDIPKNPSGKILRRKLREKLTRPKSNL